MKPNYHWVQSETLRSSCRSGGSFSLAQSSRLNVWLCVTTLVSLTQAKSCRVLFSDHAGHTAIPAFGFKGHLTAAVSRGRRGRSYSCTRVLQSHSRWLFFCFLRCNDRTKTGVCLLSFLRRSLRLTKTVLKPKKRAMQALFPLSGGLLVSELFQSEKQRSLDDQRHRSDGLRSANRKNRGIVTQSLKWKRGPLSQSHSWYRTFTDVQTPVVLSITHKQTWLHMNSDVDCMRNSSHQV